MPECGQDLLSTHLRCSTTRSDTVQVLSLSCAAADSDFSSLSHRPACVASPGFGASGGLIRPFPFCKPVSGASPFTLEFRQVGICLTHHAAIPSIREWKTILGT